MIDLLRGRCLKHRMERERDFAPHAACRTSRNPMQRIPSVSGIDFALMLRGQGNPEEH
jgi:hypothetical protein